MKIGPITLFKRDHSNGKPIKSFTIAALHWDWSLTWRWGFGWSPWYKPPGVQGFTFMRKRGYKSFNFTTGLNLPYIGHFRLETQPNMKKK